MNGHVEGLITPENERQRNTMIYNDLFCTFMATSWTLYYYPAISCFLCTFPGL
uniref:Uncharacterized protein n=1 Tax=Candidatus Kentrum sp. FM TaxID=2126340 RepID=A0A450W044_9GAMM|nr:MAG: hypothetical protein BECKFM1743A_GA0114220_101328 [Candidatus Kentron sp. FM]VFK10423.1 MAG: hypothetical protein BECKFM1743B_GA0114221_101399 [Candidatus Kentron sp. FM]